MASTSAAHHSSSSAAASSRSDCPCKRLSLSLSSATSAEYGDVVSLARRIRNSSSSSSSSSVAKFGGGGGGGGGDGGGRGRPSRIGVGPGQSSSSTSSSSADGGDADFLNDGGITPLHLAAQHNHAGAVRLLLGEGGRDVDTGLVVVASTATPSPPSGVGTGGATPLHRASFSGAISSMRVLLSWGTDDGDDGDDGDDDGGGGGGGGRIRPPGSGRRAADLLARDASYGDLRTPLHKAVAGGRPLAVQLLMVCASRRRGGRGGGALREAMMRARDASGRTPLESARAFASMSPDEAEAERASVRRWDAVAGGAGADWDTCLRLLERAAADDDVARDGESTSTSMTTTMGMAPTPDSEEASAALAEGGGAATSRRRGRPRQLMPPYCQKMPEATFDEFLNEAGNKVYCGDYEGDAACRDGRCLSAVWEHAFRKALASSIEMSLVGGGGGGATTLVDGRGMTTTADLVRYVDDDCVDERPVVNEEVSPSNRPTASIIAQMRPAAKLEVEMSSDDYPSSLGEIAIVGNTDESSADENTTAMGRRCDSCGMHTIALFRSMANHQLLVCRQCRRRRGRV